jgi:hypothetical protein
MLGFGSRKLQEDDRLPVLVQVVQSDQAFAMANKLWQENLRAVRLDPVTSKEFLRFGLVQQGQAVWFERDQGRQDSFEIILTWHDNGMRTADIYVVTPTGTRGSTGDANYTIKILDALLSTPATLPVESDGSLK